MKKSKRIFILTALLFSFLSFPVSQVFATPDMAEVAIAAVEAVFDWRAYLEENFPEKTGNGEP